MSKATGSSHLVSFAPERHVSVLKFLRWTRHMPVRWTLRRVYGGAVCYEHAVPSGTNRWESTL